MDRQLSARIKQFPDEIMKLQDSLQDILNKISGWTKDGDDMQLRLLLPRLQYLQSMITALKDNMEDAAGQIEEFDTVTGQIVMQQLLSLENLKGQLSEITDTINTSLKTLDESYKQVLIADIMRRCSELETAAKELK